MTVTTARRLRSIHSFSALGLLLLSLCFGSPAGSEGPTAPGTRLIPRQSPEPGGTGASNRREERQRRLLERSMRSGIEALVALPLIASPDPATRLRGETIFLQRIDTERTRIGFLEIDLLLALRLFPKNFSDGGRLKVRRWLQQILISDSSIATHDFVHANDNWPFISALFLIVGGEIVDSPTHTQEGTRRLETWLDISRDLGASSEYNSPTYSALSIAALEAIADFAGSLRARVAARVIVHRIWSEIASRYHAPTSQLAPPHARSALSSNLGVRMAMQYTIYPLLDREPAIDQESFPGLPAEYGRVAEHHFTRSFLTADLRAIFETKAFPYLVRAIIYQRAILGQDYVRPAGFHEITTHLSRNVAMGSAPRPYGLGEHSTPFGIYWTPADSAGAPALLRSLYARYRVDDAMPDIARGKALADAGIISTRQEDRAAILLQRPRPGVEGKRTGLMASLLLPIPENAAAPSISVGATAVPIPSYPFEADSLPPLVVRDGVVSIAIHPFSSPGLKEPAKLRIEQKDSHIAISVIHLDSSLPIEVSRQVLSELFAGFAIEATDDDSFDSWPRGDASGGPVLTARSADGRIHIRFRRDDKELVLVENLETLALENSGVEIQSSPLISQDARIELDGEVTIGEVTMRGPAGESLMLTRAPDGSSFTALCGFRKPGPLEILTPHWRIRSAGFGMGRITFEVGPTPTLFIDNARSSASLIYSGTKVPPRVVLNDVDRELDALGAERWKIELPTAESGECPETTLRFADAKFVRSENFGHAGVASVRIHNGGGCTAEMITTFINLIGPFRSMSGVAHRVETLAAGKSKRLKWSIAGDSSRGDPEIMITVVSDNASTESISLPTASTP